MSEPKNMNEPATVFISIASYRDPELLPTLKDMLCHAAQPQLLHIAICWQDNEALEVFEQAGFVRLGLRHIAGYEVVRFRYRQATIDIISVHFYASQGACWARSLAEMLFENERYFLQVDSHCRFIPAWDREMKEMWLQLQEHSPRPIVSAYPPPYIPGEEEEASKKRYVSRLIFREYNPQGIPMFSSVPFIATEPVRGSYLAGGFIFTHGEFVNTVPNDPQIFFAGEEIAMAARAFTHGYDVYHPHKPLLWHYYQRENHSKVWSDHTGEARERGNVAKTWWERDAVAKKRVRTLLGLEAETADTLTPYTLGQLRPLRHFDFQTGLSLQHGSALPEVLGNDKINYFSALPTDEAVWLERHFAFFSKNLALNKADYCLSENAMNSLQLSVYNAQNNLLYKRSLAFGELEKLRTKSSNDKFHVQVQFKTKDMTARPAVIRVCPWSDITGWGKLAEQSW